MKEHYSIRYDNWNFLWETDDIDKVVRLTEQRKTVEEIETETGSRCIRHYKSNYELYR